MKAFVQGIAQDVTTRSYVDKDGTTQHVFDAFVGEGRFFDPISGPASMAPAAGELVAYEAIVRAKLSKAGNAYLSVWCVGVATPALASV